MNGDWEGEHPGEAIAFQDEELAVHIIQSAVVSLEKKRLQGVFGTICNETHLERNGTIRKIQVGVSFGLCLYFAHFRGKDSKKMGRVIT